MPWLDYRALRERISMRDVLRLMGYEPLRRRGDQWRGRCPLCAGNGSFDRSSRASSPPSAQPLSRVNGPSEGTRRGGRVDIFSVHLGRNAFRCFRCDREGNQFDLWSQYTSLTLHAAVRDLCHRLQIAEIEIPQPPTPRRPTT